MPPNANTDQIRLSEDDLHLFREGTHFHLYEKMGSHVAMAGGKPGTRFAVWAPNAEQLSVVGDFNGWNPDAHPLSSRGNSGIWEGFVAGVGVGTRYKYHVRGPNGYRFDKTDPYAFSCRGRPDTASVVTDLSYTWDDAEWMTNRKGRNGLTAPTCVYEMHLGSWRRKPDEGNRSLTYRELAAVVARLRRRATGSRTSNSCR